MPLPDSSKSQMKEILDRLRQRGFRAHLADGTCSNAYDPEGMKCVIEEMCMEAGVPAFDCL